MNHVYDFCLADKLGASGLPAALFQRYMDAAAKGAARLRQAHDEAKLAHLAVAVDRADLAGIESTAARIRAAADDVVICGTGGSSLGGQALAQIAGWRAPMTGAVDNGKPRLHFLDNLDAESWQRLFGALDLAGTHVLVISKSGGTAETLTQLLLAASAYDRAGLELAGHVTAISDPLAQGRANALRDFLRGRGAPILDHHPGIGGRYAALTNVGLLPAALAGLNIADVRAGTREVAEAFLRARSDLDCPAIVGAALNAAFALEKGCRMTVLMAYSDKLERFTRWFVQLWAESLGKQGKGSTPLGALGPVDQHSQLQLFLDGPRDKLFTLIQTDAAGTGQKVDAALAAEAGNDALAGRSMGDLVDSMQRATADTLARNGRPVRTLRIDSVNARAIGALMMHFMLETIIAAHIFDVDPFDQPAVEEGKVLAKRYLADI